MSTATASAAYASSSIPTLSRREAGAAAPAWVAVEDLEGLDLADRASVKLRGPQGEAAVTIRTKKGLPRRVIVLEPTLGRSVHSYCTPTHGDHSLTDRSP